MISKSLGSLEKRISSLLRKVKKKKKKAKKSKVKAYFEGQQTAFEKISLELKILKDESEISVEHAEKEIPPKLEEKDIAEVFQEALEKGVIIRKSSFYFHEDLPNGKIQGKKKVLEALRDNTFCENIQHQLAKS